MNYFKLVLIIAALFFTAQVQAQYTIEAQYEPASDSLEFYEVLNNYVRDFNVSDEVLMLRLSLISTQVEGYEIEFNEEHIEKFKKGQLVLLPKSEKVFRAFIRDEYAINKP
jgi:hypothetical protein